MARPANLGHYPDFRLGKLHVRPSHCEVVGPGGGAHIEPRMMQVLVELAAAQGATVTRDDLIERCWDNRIVSDGVISRVILHLRKIARTIGEDAYSIITVPKIGYRITVKESEHSPLPAASDNHTHALAVLPFRNMAEGDGYFAEGIAEEVRSQLSRHSAFRVAGHTSSQLIGQLSDVGEIGRRLNVSHLVEGSVRKADGRVRIDVALVDTGNGHRVWADIFEGETDDIFAVQNRIGLAIAASLQARLDDVAGPEQARTPNGAAYELYLVAKTLLRFRSPDHIATAIDLLERATALDASFAPAWARLGVAHAMRAMFRNNASCVADARRQALDYVQHAIALAPKSSEVHAAHGALLYQDDIEAAGCQLERAAALGEDTSELWFWLCAVYDRTGDYMRSIAAARRTVQIDPLWYGSAFAALTALDAGLEDEATKWLLAFSSNGTTGLADLVSANLALYHNDYTQAFAAAKRAMAGIDTPLRSLASATVARALLGLDLPAQARDVDPSIVTEREADLRQGQLPPDILDKPFEGDRRNLRINPERYFGLRQLVRDGFASDVVAYYRRSAGSPEALRNHPDGHLAFLADAAIIARAMKETGDGSEAHELAKLARTEMERREAAGMVPRSYALSKAQICAVLDDESRALEALGEVKEKGVSPLHPASLQHICKDPIFDTLRNAPRFRAIAADFEGLVAHQRALVGELIAPSRA